MLNGAYGKVSKAHPLPWLASFLLVFLWIEHSRASSLSANSEIDHLQPPPGILTRFQNYALAPVQVKLSHS